MRLVGGNISDTPVKEIGDGSAFTVGGSGGVVPKTLSGLTTATRLTSMDNFENNSLSINMMHGVDTCEVAAGASSDKWCMVYRSAVDNKVKGIIINFDSDATPTEGVQQGLDAFTTVANGPVQVYRVSDSKVMVLSHRLNGTNLEAELQLYDISGTTMSASSNGRQTVTWQGGSNRPYDLMSTQLLILDADRLVLSAADYNHTNDNRIHFIGVRFTSTQNVGSWFDSNWSSPKPGAGGGRMVPNGAGKFLTHNDGYSTFSWNYSAASTPVVSLDAEISSGVHGSAFVTVNSHQRDENHFMQNPASDVVAEYMAEGAQNGLRYYSGSADDTITRFTTAAGINRMVTSSGDQHRRTRLLSVEGDNWQILQSFCLAGTHQHAVIVCNIVTGATVVSQELSVTTSPNVPSEHLGTVIVPRNNPAKASIYGYQDASTAGWYRYTIDIST